MIATITALVLGLITAAVKSSFDELNVAVKRSAADILILDRTLALQVIDTVPLSPSSGAC